MRAWHLGLLAGVLACGTWWLRADVVDWVSVSSGSMAPTFCPGDRLLIQRAGAEDAGLGDIVTFPAPGDKEHSLKRVVAVEGQVMQIWDGLLYVDGRRRHEGYVDQSTVDGTFYQKVLVGPGEVFVLGDDRETSIDSRDYGPVARSALEGRVLTRLWSGCE